MSSISDDEYGANVHIVPSLEVCKAPCNSSGHEAMDPEDGMIDVNAFNYEDVYRVEQYAQGVLDFSSQYGSDYSISYTALNIIGRPSKYPAYGDFPETFAMRTYGDWWTRVPSYGKEIQPQNLPEIPTHDFIVVDYENYIIPEKITIFETFNPGAVVRIWAYTILKTWFCLWESECYSLYPAREAREFKPILKKLLLPTKTIRIEFNHSRLNYFTEIDAVLLCGKNVSERDTEQLLHYYECQRKGSITRKLHSIQFRPNFEPINEGHVQDIIMRDINQFVSVLAIPNNENTIIDNEYVTSGQSLKTTSGLKDMPFEILLNIFSYLDLMTLFRVGEVSHFFYDVSKHPLLYSEVNLKPYWHLITSDVLCTLAKRATVLRKLDLSWCGLCNAISPTEFKKFVQQRGDTLTHLRLNSCTFLNASCIETLGIVCDNLNELSLRNCSTDPQLPNFSCLANLKNLERLDLLQTTIEPELLLTMLESNRNLKHLNLAFSGVAINMDEVAQHIAVYNLQLVSLDIWKSHFLSGIGVKALSNCHQLEEVDFGWCLREVALGDSLTQLIKNCTKLKKLFLATVRGITDRDIENIANLCANLEQLDLMGVLGISKERYYEILVKCKNLQLLDLSFCDNVEAGELGLWSRHFKVNIKCSHLFVDVRYI